MAPGLGAIHPAQHEIGPGHDGAGPTGLALGIGLQRRGVTFRLVEQALRLAQYSQAPVVPARTLEQFEREGIAKAAVQQSRPKRGASLFSEGNPVANIRFGQGIPGALGVGPK